MQLKIYTDFEKNLPPDDLVITEFVPYSYSFSFVAINFKEKAIFFLRLNIWCMFRLMSCPFRAVVIFIGVANLTENWLNTDNFHSKCFTKMKSSL